MTIFQFTSNLTLIRFLQNMLTLLANIKLLAHLGAHPVWHAEHLRAADTPLRQATPYAPVLNPPLQLEAILAHRRLPGRGLNYELTVKYVDKPLDFQPNKINLKDALVKGHAVTRDYFAKWHLGSL